MHYLKKFREARLERTVSKKKIAGKYNRGPISLTIVCSHIPT